MKKLFAIGLLLIGLLSSLHLQAQEVETLVQIDTDMGKIKVKLFNDTPSHRIIYSKSEEEQLRRPLLHRVIKQFMVQGRRHQLEDAPIEQHLGTATGYTTRRDRLSEIFPQTRYALCRPYQRRRESGTHLIGYTVLHRYRKILYGNGTGQDGGKR